MPLQLFSMFGMLVSAVALVTYFVVIVERLVLSGWREGLATLWDRDILAFFLIGMMLFGVGLIGEYVGRIYQQVRDRPRFTVQAVLETSRGCAGGRRPGQAIRCAERRASPSLRRNAIIMTALSYSAITTSACAV